MGLYQQGDGGITCSHFENPPSSTGIIKNSNVYQDVTTGVGRYFILEKYSGDF